MLLNQSPNTNLGGVLPLELASILLVEADLVVRSSRRMVMASLQHPVRLWLDIEKFRLCLRIATAAWW